MLILKRELLFEFVDDLLTSIDKDCTGLVNTVYLLDGLMSAILAYERSVSEFEVPGNGIKIVKSWQNLKETQFYVDLVIYYTASRIQKSNTFFW